MEHTAFVQVLAFETSMGDGTNTGRATHGTTSISFPAMDTCTEHAQILHDCLVLGMNAQCTLIPQLSDDPAIFVRPRPWLVPQWGWVHILNM